MSIGPGTKLGQYTLIQEIGSGSFATAWLATDTKTNSNVVVKLFHSTVDPDDAEAAKVEWENCKRLQITLGDERNLVRMLGQIDDPDPLKPPVALVIEYCSGGTLERFW